MYVPAVGIASGGMIAFNSSFDTKLAGSGWPLRNLHTRDFLNASTWRSERASNAASFGHESIKGLDGRDSWQR